MSKRADAIRSKVSIYDVLGRYGYDIKSDYQVEQQFSCDLHGDTSDDKPSARVYPESNSWYCFACGKARDAIETVRDKESCDFNKACFMLEEWYGLPHFVYKEKEEDRIDPMSRISASVVDNIDSVKSQIDRLLRVSYQENIFPRAEVIRIWEMFDMVTYHLDEGIWDEEACKIRYGRIRDKIMICMGAELDE